MTPRRSGTLEERLAALDASDAGAENRRGVAKPARLSSTRSALADERIAELVTAASTSCNDPELDALIVRLHIETACRRGGALGLRPRDLDVDQCLIMLREKGGRNIDSGGYPPGGGRAGSRLIRREQRRRVPYPALIEVFDNAMLPAEKRYPLLGRKPRF